MSASAYRLSIAPMMACTDRHYRYLMRLITRYTRLYTEMVTANAVLHGDVMRLLGFDPCESPLALQLGGNHPQRLAAAAKRGEQMGYDEINLNVGCPSPRVQTGAFGAALMLDPDCVQRCVAAMKQQVSIPVTVKTRIGVDDQDDLESLLQFVDGLLQVGCDVIAIHARKAWLNGLSPKENRNIPPLQYDRVYAVKQAYPDAEIVINGGINFEVEAIQQCLSRVNGVMIGRHAYADPYQFSMADSVFFADRPAVTRLSRSEVALLYIEYAKRQVIQGASVHQVIRHALNLFKGQPQGKNWRRWIAENCCRKGSGIAQLEQLQQWVLSLSNPVLP